MKLIFRFCFGCAIAALSVPTFAKSTAERVRESGRLRCGVVATPEDWNKTDLHAPLVALDLEICRAVAIAVIGSAGKLDATSFKSEIEAEDGLYQGQVDLIVGVTPEATAMWRSKIAFGPPVFYDGQGFLVRADAPVNSLAQLGGLKVCFIEGTDNEPVLLARAKALGTAIIPLPFQEEGEMDDGLAVRHCDVVSAQVSRLAMLKATYPKQLGRDKILTETLTLAPLSPAYRRDDVQWSMIVDWTVYALIQAEISGVTRANVQAKRDSEDPQIQRLLGSDPAVSRDLGLAARDWLVQVIAVVGNYGEIYDRTVGMNSDLKLPRGLNAPWTSGGIMHPLPVQ